MNGLERVEDLIAQIDSCPDPDFRAAARELAAALMDFHGSALARILEMVDAATLQALGRDEAIRPLLLLYDLHPESTETRVRRALDRVRNVDYVAVEDLEVTVRVTGHGHHPSREAIETAILDAAPEVRSIRIEGLQAADFVPLEKLAAV